MTDLDKMAATLADDNFKYIFLIENDRILIRISLKFVPMGPIRNKPLRLMIDCTCFYSFISDKVHKNT